MSSLNGDETVSHILGIAEDAIFDFGSLLEDRGDAPELLGNGLDDYLKYLEENQTDQLGIPTGYPTYDYSIGGGLRRGTVNVIGARPKVGKTLLADNIGVHIASETDIPVLNLDTEMLKEDHQHRTLALISEVGITDIETGKFSQNPDQKSRVYSAKDKLENLKYYHQCIGGMPFEEQLSIMRRWLNEGVYRCRKWIRQNYMALQQLYNI